MSTESITYLYDVITDVASPLPPCKLEAPGGELLRLIVKGEVTDCDWQKLAECAARYKNVTIVYSVRQGVRLDLCFLKFFSNIHEVCLHSHWYAKATGLEELDHLPDDLEKLTLSVNNSKLSLGLVKRLKNLKDLQVTGTLADMEVLAGLGKLESLLLNTSTLPDIAILGSLKGLKKISVYHGSNSDLSVLGGLPRLEDVFLWRIRGLSSLDWLAELVPLQQLEIGGQIQVRDIPPLKKQTKLRRVRMDQMKGLTSLSWLAAASGLAEVHLSAMDQLTVDDYRCLVGHPALQRLTSGFKSRKKKLAVAEMTELPDVTYPQLNLREF
ncbi:hypothetical protein [Prosthecobacter fluviatilis]|uniref:Internalin-A n=1 Tax=Prosthecobacter fluviatilis TaxID=445931 RepID=A0ABW0KPQ0_9BACT